MKDDVIVLCAKMSDIATLVMVLMMAIRNYFKTMLDIKDMIEKHKLFAFVDGIS